MTSIFYLSTVSKEYYSTQALIGYVKNLQQNNITNAADALGVSVIAIAGAMAEENSDYWHKQTLNPTFRTPPVNKYIKLRVSITHFGNRH